MEFKDLKIKTIGDLQTLLAQERDKLRDLRFKDSNKQLKDVNQIKQTKKLIANILTLLNQKSKETK